MAMKKLMVKRFAHWYGVNKRGKSSNYLKNNFKDDILVFEEKLEEISDEFVSNYNVHPFDFDINDVNSIELKINAVKSKLEIKSPGFVAYNKRFGNGIPNALLGKNNYLAYMSSLLSTQGDDEQKEYSGFFLRKEFITYLINEEDYTAGSAKDYASYVASANKYILKDALKVDFFNEINSLCQSKNLEAIEDLLNLCVSIVLKKADDSKKNKYKSGLCEYKGFLLNLLSDGESFEELDSLSFASSLKGSSDEDEKNGDFIFTEIPEGEFSEIVIDKDSLISNFKFRMITQDRLYGDVYFPVRLLKKVFYQNKEHKVLFDDFILKQIKEIKIFLSDSGEFVLLDDIYNLSIINNKVYVETEKEVSSWLVYTELANEGEYDVLSVSKLREIAIDHVIPMKSLLEEHKNNLSGLFNLTELLKSKGITKSGPESVKMLSIVGNEIIDSDLITEKELDLIKDDFAFLKDKLELQLMSSKSNLGKNNR